MSGKEEEIAVRIGLHIGDEFFARFLSSPISTGGLLRMFLMSPGSTLVCFLTILVTLCWGLDFEKGGKCEFGLHVYGLRNAGFF